MALIPPLSPTLAATALGRGVAGWMPYAEDPPKRARYRAFLAYRAGLANASVPARAEGTSSKDWVQELQEFAHAATIFKPMTGMMARRFTSSRSTLPTSEQLGAGDDGEETLLRQPEAKPMDPALEAARVGMFGPLTRSSERFYPSRLLCKRFNVRVPEHVVADLGAGPEPGTAGGTGGEQAGGRFASGGFQTSTKKLELVGREDMEALRRESGLMGGGDGDGGGGHGGERKEEVVVDPERNEALEAERPGEAVFRAIFGSDSEGEE